MTTSALTPADVCVVTVTYGDRFGLLEQVLHAVLAADVGHVVVVDNNSEDSSQQALAQFANAHSQIHVLTMPRNLGSAGGYAAGINAANQLPCEFIWLLDDDNVPADNALELLLNAYLNVSHEHHPVAVAALRDDRPNLKAWAQGVRTAITRPSSVLGFHLLDIPAKLVGRFQQKTPCNLCRLPFAPYGGLLLPRNVIDTIGLPNTPFYLYSDDYEYTYRITRAGGHIYLLPDALIYDVDTSWLVDNSSSGTRKIRPFQRLFLTESDTRIYYTTRNALYWTRHVRTGPYAWFIINLLLVKLGLIVEAVLSGNWQRWRLLQCAMRDGLSRQLGEVEVTSLPPRHNNMPHADDADKVAD
ncbi:MAG: glycosyltransferase [Deinococcota bacterium]